MEQPSQIQREYRRLDFKIMKATYSGEKSEDDRKFHNFHELFYVSEGDCSVFLGRYIYHIRSGDFAIIPAGCVHKTDYLSKGLNTKYVLSFSKRIGAEIEDFLGERILERGLKLGRVGVPVQRREHIETLLARMLYEYEEQPEHARSVLRVSLAEILLSILRYRTGGEGSAGEIGAEQERMNERMQAVAAYLADNAEEELPLERLAEQFALSPSYLSRTFKRATGFGIKEYLTQIRMQKAADLLLSTQLSVLEIAERCGYNDSNYFGDAFKRATGLSPRQYRKLG